MSRLQARLTLRPEATAYLERHGSALTIRSSPRHGCCGGTVGVPVAEPGSPADTAAFDALESDGVRVYVERGLVTSDDDPITVGVDGFGPLRRLWVQGLDITM
jgi:hypothetical protein